ncbi:16S rRNA (cytidine(1402)-2'-O)-methyltransferase [Candidatus Dojkabacteria bacterium]|uniref:16S rRNA (Cytidine(1402)-2'-O)-methyltransferase n=1 Tax=Candidatus Dojkabacteria bacterium TaxID=2099670 RepID=A0A955LAH5_9BACT|nr:16S rRNA (cytidine(1402)-2'-O)-methyltransferase [Candidatus Dojkabacteria bacterium]
MGKLIILGTTIGNVEDISIRALRHIFESQVVLAEDTRVFIKFKNILKDRYLDTLESLEINIDTKQNIHSYREQNHDRVVKDILEQLKDEDVAIATDAGMPGISDPGFKLIRDVIEAGFEIDVVPGPTAVTSAFVLSGLPTDYYSFVGFLPRKKSKIQKLLDNYNLEQTSLIVYESPFRVIKSLEILKELYGDDLSVSAVGEITKKFQRVERGKVAEVISNFRKQAPKGEWVIVIRKL